MNLFLSAFLKGEFLSTEHFEKKLAEIPEAVKRYRQVEKSQDLADLYALEKEIHSPEFQAKKLEVISSLYGQTPKGKMRSESARAKEMKAHPQLWNATEEGQKEARYHALKANKDILFYQQTKAEDIERFESMKPIYSDDFHWTDLAHSDWQPGFYYPSKDFVAVHSYTNEVQAFNNGKNVEVKDGKLIIHTRKQKVTAPAWDADKGMVMHPFTYTSDVINNAKVFSMEEGVIQVKARCTGILNHGIYLRGDKHLPFISIFDFTGMRLYCGLKGSQHDDSGKKELDRLYPITDLVFTVAWDKEDIVWYINNIEVHRTRNTMPKGEKLYLHMYSFGFKKDRHMTPGDLEVSYVRAFAPVKK